MKKNSSILFMFCCGLLVNTINSYGKSKDGYHSSHTIGSEWSDVEESNMDNENQESIISPEELMDTGTPTVEESQYENPYQGFSDGEIREKLNSIGDEKKIKIALMNDDYKEELKKLIKDTNDNRLIPLIDLMEDPVVENFKKIITKEFNSSSMSQLNKYFQIYQELESKKYISKDVEGDMTDIICARKSASLNDYSIKKNEDRDGALEILSFLDKFSNVQGSFVFQIETLNEKRIDLVCTLCDMLNVETNQYSNPIEQKILENKIDIIDLKIKVLSQKIFDNFDDYEEFQEQQAYEEMKTTNNIKIEQIENIMKSKGMKETMEDNPLLRELYIKRFQNDVFYSMLKNNENVNKNININNPFHFYNVVFDDETRNIYIKLIKGKIQTIRDLIKIQKKEKIYNYMSGKAVMIGYIFCHKDKYLSEQYKKDINFERFIMNCVYDRPSLFYSELSL